MAKVKLLNPNPLRCAVGVDVYLWIGGFDTNATSAPDGIDYDDGETTYAYGGSGGLFNITFPADKAPYELLAGHVIIPGSNPGISGRVVSYTASTGVLVIQLYDEDNTSGIEGALANTSDGLAVKVVCWFTKSSEGLG